MEEVAEPVLTLEQISRCLNVSTKTISRWRDCGLVSRRVVCNGRRQVGFLKSLVDRFVAHNRDRVERGGRFSQLSEEEREDILRRAKRLSRVGHGTLTEVSRREPIVLSPPLTGDRWVDTSGCCEIIFAHRYTLNPTNGTLGTSERFAIDFWQLDAQGRVVVGDIKELTNWHCYGAEVVAAAAGEVVQVVNDLPDQVLGEPVSGVTGETAPGNHVIIEVSSGAFVALCHLQHGSARVSLGQSVAVGDGLGRCGNSGNSTEPHVHVQAMDGPDPSHACAVALSFRGRLPRNREIVAAP